MPTTPRTVLLTGAAGGIGAATARALHARGDRLALVDRDADRLRALAATLPGSTVHTGDVADPSDWARWGDEVRAAHGSLRGLVHNAGWSVYGPVASQSLDELRRVVEIDLLAVMLGTRVLLPDLLAHRPSQVVIVSSMSALYGTPMQASYSAAKAGVRVFGEALRIELSNQGVGVSVILPGTIATPFLQRAGTTDARASSWLGARMLQVGSSPDRVARAIAWALDHDPAELRVGPDSHVVAWSRRVWPTALPAALRALWRRLT